MARETLKPREARWYFITQNRDGKPTDEDFGIAVTDALDEDNDYILEVDHPEWNDKWEDHGDCNFYPFRNDEEGEEYGSLEYERPLDTVDKARAWLLSIGMMEDFPNI